MCSELQIKAGKQLIAINIYVKHKFTHLIAITD